MIVLNKYSIITRYILFCGIIALSSLSSANGNDAFKVLVTPKSEPFLIKDLIDEKVVRNFRYVPLSEVESLNGWHKLNASVSGVYSSSFLYFLKTFIKKRPIYVLDLRAESHGFIDGKPVTWYGFRNATNQGKSLSQIEVEEYIDLQKLSDTRYLQAYYVKQKDWGVIKTLQSTDIFTHRVETEQQLVKRHGLNYFRIPVLDRHRPTDRQVDLFLAFVSQLPENAWVHLHCLKGSGRSTTILVMYDIIKNGDRASFSDIINRNSLISPKNMRVLPPKHSWKYAAAKERLRFLENFYAYRNDPKGFGYMTWSMWSKKNV